jgi:hypothetical protein
VCARVANQQSRGVVTARVRTDAVRSLRHQRRDLHQSTYPVPLGRSGLILLSIEAWKSFPRGSTFAPKELLSGVNFSIRLKLRVKSKIEFVIANFTTE